MKVYCKDCRWLAESNVGSLCFYEKKDIERDGWYGPYIERVGKHLNPERANKRNNCRDYERREE